MKKRLIRTAILSAAACIIGAGLALYQVRSETAQVRAVGSQPAAPGAVAAGTTLGGVFSLTDQDGKAVTEADYAGSYKIVYFGFTFCPMICPTELQKIARVMNSLGDKAAQVQPLFISVDPERDTPAVLKAYTAQFYPRLIGLTGSKEAIEAVKNAYKVFSKKTEDEQMADYTVDHSAFIYFMTPDNKLAALYRTADTADQIAADIASRLGPP